MRRQQADLPQRFRTWMNSVAADDTAVKEWLNGLSDEGIQAFTKHLETFCTDMGFELGWLIDHQLEQNPELTQMATAIVLNYCRACQQAALAQEDLEAYKKLKAFEQHPANKRQQAFGEKLFARVIEEGLVVGSVSDYLGAPPEERSRLMVEAVRKAAEKNPQAFSRVLKETLTATKASGTSKDQQPTVAAYTAPA
jgi:hypothetical protein